MRECGVLGSARLDGGTEVGGGLGRLVCSEYVHRRTQVGTIDNTTTAWVLDECNSPSLLMSGQMSVRKVASAVSQVTVLNTSH